jgi:hypothetical protein
MYEQAVALQGVKPGAESGKSARAAHRLEFLPALGTGRKGVGEPRDRLRLSSARRRIVADQARVLRRLDRRPKLGAGLGETQLDDLARWDAACSDRVARSNDICDPAGGSRWAVGPDRLRLRSLAVEQRAR